VLIAHCVVAGLDRGHFHWSDRVPGWLQAVALIAMASSFALVLWAMVVNRFFSSVIRIQNDRGQHVISTGPYAVIRHPGYLAGIVFVVTSGVALGSWYAALMLTVFTVPFLLYRVTTEDGVLHAELPGYTDYATRVRWRLVPGVW
jgi:protein-S-isoprenylcysteine O-methyltransferase Ste14